MLPAVPLQVVRVMGLGHWGKGGGLPSAAGAGAEKSTPPQSAGPPSRPQNRGPQCPLGAATNCSPGLYDEPVSEHVQQAVAGFDLVGKGTRRAVAMPELWHRPTPKVPPVRHVRHLTVESQAAVAFPTEGPHICRIWHYNEHRRFDRARSLVPVSCQSADDHACGPHRAPVPTRRTVLRSPATVNCWGSARRTRRIQRRILTFERVLKHDLGARRRLAVEELTVVLRVLERWSVARSGRLHVSRVQNSAVDAAMNTRAAANYLAVPLYLDGHATTPCSPGVVAAMLPYFTTLFGNPSSTTHRYGDDADRAVRAARKAVAGLIGASPSEITFVSSATEACNLVLKGGNWRRVVTVATEHKAVLASCEMLAKSGVDVEILPVQSDGLLDLERLRVALQIHTDLVAVMGANNEIGTLQPVAAIAELCRAAGARLLVDATQLVPWFQVDVGTFGADFLVFSAHKMYGPKGAGALYAKKGPRAELLRQIDGGGQESGFRAGTSNVPAIVGFGQAASELIGRYDAVDRVRTLRDQLLADLQTSIGDLVVHGCLGIRLPNNLCLSVPGIEADVLLSRLPDLALSSGSACYSGAPEPSYVVRALGVNYREAWSAFRVGLTHEVTAAEIAYAAGRISYEVQGLRALEGPAGNAILRKGAA